MIILHNRVKLSEWCFIQRQSKRQVVFTNGCYDLFHAGHATFLASLRDSCPPENHRLIVALNDDDSIRRLKGSGRPLNSLEDRARVMGAVRHVDCVTSFAENTPLEIIKFLKPDVLAKGGDYQGVPIVGEKEVLEWGGYVLKLDLYEGVSTTTLCKKVLKSEPVEGVDTFQPATHEHGSGGLTADEVDGVRLGDP